MVAIVVAGALATPAGAVTVRTFQSGITPASQPTRIAAGANGNLYFTENAVDKVGQISLGGTITEFASAHAGGPFGITAGSDGSVYYTVSTGGVARFPTGSFLMSVNGLEDITAGPDGALWFTENAGNAVYRSNGVTFANQITTLPSSGPSGIAAGPDGNLWVTESTAHKVARIDTNGNVLSEIPLTAGAGPAGIAAGPDGNMWLAEKTAGRIARITPTGTVTEFPVLPSGAGSQPTSIVAGPDGNMWVTEAGVGRIGRITTSGAVTEFLSGAQPRGITVGLDSNLWFAGGSGYIGRVNLGLPAPRYTNPDAITVAASPNSSGPADTYPSTIEASGLSGTVSEVSVRLNGVYHPNADDLEALLVGPQGQTVLLLADSAGGGSNQDPGSGQVITFDDDGVSTPAKLVNGIFQAHLGPQGGFAAPAPSPFYGVSLSEDFDGTDPNGVWQLYLQDDNAAFGRGVIAGGWSLDIETIPDPVGVPGPTVQVPVPGPTVTQTGPTVTVPGPSLAPPADTTAPRLTLGTVATRLAQATFRKGLAVRVTPSETVTLDVTLSVKPSRATLAAADQLVLFDRTFTASRATTLAVKPSARRLGRPKKTFRALLRIVASDNAGNRATVSKTITVQPDKKKLRR